MSAEFHSTRKMSLNNPEWRDPSLLCNLIAKTAHICKIRKYQKRLGSETFRTGHGESVGMHSATPCKGVGNS